MRSCAFARILTLFIAAVFLASASSGQASSDAARTKRLTRQLYHLPIGGGQAFLINKLVCALTKMHPKFRLRYYNIGVVRLSDEHGIAASNALKIKLAVLKILKKAGIPPSRGSWMPQIISDKGYGDDSTPTPTPEPTPAPTP